MRKKLLTVALAATMAVSSMFTAFAEDFYSDSYENKTNDAYAEVENPLKGKNAETVVINYTINFTEGTAKNGWDGIFAFFDEASGGRVSFQTAPYICFNAGADEKWIDLKADAWCTANCEDGKDYTFEYVITKDSIEVTCDGTKIAEFVETGRGTGAATEGFQDILDALNTYPTLTLGVGLAKSAYWNTELAAVTLKISDSPNVAADPADPTEPADPADPTEAPTEAQDNVTPAKTGDTSAVAVIAIVALGAAVAVVASKKRVTE